jgi:hypothetical protein
VLTADTIDAILGQGRYFRKSGSALIKEFSVPLLRERRATV